MDKNKLYLKTIHITGKPNATTDKLSQLEMRRYYTAIGRQIYLHPKRIYSFRRSKQYRKHLKFNWTKICYLDLSSNFVNFKKPFKKLQKKSERQ
jgi:hypothetical protein